MFVAHLSYMMSLSPPFADDVRVQQQLFINDPSVHVGNVLLSECSGKIWDGKPQHEHDPRRGFSLERYITNGRVK